MKHAIESERLGFAEQRSSELIAGIEHRWADVNGVHLHYACAGSGEPMVFLHGFPQFWYAWRHQLAEFARDHFVIAPDLRGFNLSSRPESIDDYQVEHLVEDVRALLVDHLGLEQCVLVGHDWGGFVAWAVAIYHPQILQDLVILATTHPSLLDRALKQDPEQQRASQFSLIVRRTGEAGKETEQLLVANRFALLEASMLDFPFYSDDDRRAYREAWLRPGAVAAGLNYYRAAGIGPPEEKVPANGNYVPGRVDQTVHVPTLMLYAEGSPYVTPATIEGIEEFVPNVRLERLWSDTHWLAEERPAVVSQLMRDFIKYAMPA